VRNTPSPSTSTPGGQLSRLSIGRIGVHQHIPAAASDHWAVVLEQTQPSHARLTTRVEWWVVCRVVFLSNETRQPAVSDAIRYGAPGLFAAPISSSLQPSGRRTPCRSQSRVWALLLATKFSARSYAGPPLYHESPGVHASAGVTACMDAGVVVGPAVGTLHCAPASPTNPARPSAVPAHRFLFRASSLADRLAYLSRRVLHSQCRPCLQGLSTSFSTFPAFGHLCTLLLCIVAVPSFRYRQLVHARPMTSSSTQ
jgi:hypothetical protein